MNEQRQFLDACLEAEGRVRRPLSCVEEREQVFLNIGERLQEVFQAAGEVSEKGGALVAATSRETLEDMVAALNEALGRLKQVCRESAIGRQEEELTTIGDALKVLNRLADDFRRIVRSLGMLGISTRIESARLGADGRGFMTLADDVEGLAHNIVDYSSRVADSSRELDAMVGTALVKTREIALVQDECSTITFKELGQSVSQLHEVGMASSRSSEALAAIAKEVSDHIGAMVSSMQFHDIVRQQVEHVQESADDIFGLIRKQLGRHDDEEGWQEIVAWARDACHLQGRQLDNASQRFTDAVSGLRHELLSVHGNTEHVREAVRNMSGAENSGGGNSLDRVSKGVASIIESMDLFKTKGREVAEVMARVSAIVDDLVGLVGNIQDVGYQIELIALNASIKAAHTGEKGKALGVLASSIQSLSQEARDHTDRTADTLRIIAKASNALHDSKKSGEQAESMEQAGQTLASVITRARELGREVDGIVSGMEGLCDRLASMLQETESGLAVDRDVGRELEKARNIFIELGDRAESLVPKIEGQVHDELLTSMLERYTMEAERMVHLGEAQDDPEAGTTSAGDDWDNVELF